MEVNSLLFENTLSDSQLASLTQDELSLWISRPRGKNISEAKFWMIFRVLFLVIAYIYYLVKYGDNQEQSVLVFLLVGYEFAYYMLRNEKERRVYQEALQSWHDRLEKHNN